MRGNPPRGEYTCPQDRRQPACWQVRYKKHQLGSAGGFGRKAGRRALHHADCFMENEAVPLEVHSDFLKHYVVELGRTEGIGGKDVTVIAETMETVVFPVGS